MNYLASPPLVVAYAIAGTMDHDFEKDALGKDTAGSVKFPYERREIQPLDFENSLKTAAERVFRAYQLISSSHGKQPATMTLKSESYGINLNFCGLYSNFNTDLDF